jgi:hypothetical protein
MRHRSQNTSLTGKTRPIAGKVQSVGFDCLLPASVRAELLRERPVKLIQPPSTPAIVAERKQSAGLRSRLALAVMICTPMAMLAVLCGVIAAFGGFKSHSSPEMQRIAQNALMRVGGAQPVTRTPAVPAASSRSEPPPAPRVDLASGQDPVVRRALAVAPRAELVSPPVRRASIVRWPAATDHQ